MTANTAILKGKLSGHDTRFSALSQSVDDRTDDERDPNSLNSICQSRYSPVYSYVSENIYIQDFHNDNPKLNIDMDCYKELKIGGISTRLAEHYCNLIVRDPLVIFDEKIEITEQDDYTHFENFQSTNWNSLRFKPPSDKDKDSCCKLEFRVSEICMTPYENAAISTFLLLFTKMIWKYDFNTIIPISKVKENYNRANLNDAVIKQKFWFKTNGLSVDCAHFSENDFMYCGYKESLSEKLKYYKDEKVDNENIHELTIEEILCGCDKYKYQGIFWMMNEYIDKHVEEQEKKDYYRNHLEFIKLRSNGSLMTDAKYVRNFVLNHKDYKQDSIVSQKIAYDLVNHVLDIQNGKVKPKELFN